MGVLSANSVFQTFITPNQPPDHDAPRIRLRPQVLARPESAFRAEKPEPRSALEEFAAQSARSIRNAAAIAVKRLGTHWKQVRRASPCPGPGAKCLEIGSQPVEMHLRSSRRRWSRVETGAKRTEREVPLIERTGTAKDQSLLTSASTSAGPNQPTNFFAMTVALWPPKPKELFTIALTFISRALCGT